jgi:hypothetical protein
MTVLRTLEMSLDRAEFLRLLPAAAPGGFTRTEGPDGSTVLVRREGTALFRIRLAPLPPLCLGALTLARQRVELALEGPPPAAAEAMLDAFLKHYQRAGG